MNKNIELMQHALGINEHKREPYRNYFLASCGNPDNTAWQQLVEQGFASVGQAPSWSCGDVVYHLTDKGKVAAISSLPTPKKKTAYDEYLHADYGCSFSEWLCINQPEIEQRETGFFTGKYEYRMYRYARFNWDTYRDVEGDWQPTKKAAKASYKEALKDRKEKLRNEQ